VGAPVRNSAGDVVASVGAIGLTRDLPSDGYATVGKEVRETAESISAQLGHQRPSAEDAVAANNNAAK
jgi:DNA-binding IclR family transcriptional regulator